MNKKIRIGINGFGRIGSVVLRAIFLEKYDIEVVAINTKGDIDINSFAQQFKYDSVYGRFPYRIEVLEPQKSREIGRLQIDNRVIPFLGEPDPSCIPWKNYDVDVVLECTGAFVDSKAGLHLKGGAKKVIISAPPKSSDIPLFILGVNEHEYNNEKLISNGSCTTNCVAPIIRLIDEKIGFQQGMLTTIHAYTANQSLVDGSDKDPRRSRAAAINIVPTTTGATESVIAAYPTAKGRFTGTAIRVPVICGSYSDITFKMVREISVEDINTIFENAAVDSKLVGKIKVTYEPLVSSDIIGNNASCIIDTAMTKVVAGDMLQIGAWYDNEYGYSCRLIELAIFICK